MSDISEPSLLSSTPVVESPWQESKKGSIYCVWDDLPGDIRSGLKKEDKFQTTIGEFHYYVLRTPDDTYLVFRNPRPSSGGQQQRYLGKRPEVSELVVLPLVEANKLLGSADYVLVGDDPVKIINGNFLAVLGKRS